MIHYFRYNLPINLALSGWPHNKLLEKTIYLQVIDYDRFSRDDPIGETYIPLNEVDLSLAPLMWKFLSPCKDSRVCNSQVFIFIIILIFSLHISVFFEFVGKKLSCEKSIQLVCGMPVVLPRCGLDH